MTPKPGDVVGRCEHKPSPYVAHWYGFSEPVEVMAIPIGPGGAMIKTMMAWVLLCDRCHHSHSGSALELVRSHFTWREGMREPASRGPS